MPALTDNQLIRPHIKIRQSNFELLRIVAMILVLIVHADFFSLNPPDNTALINHPISSFMRYTVQSLALVCVNVYILISGYFGINTHTKSVCSFIFLLLFWRIIVYVIIFTTNILPHQVQPTELAINLIPGYNDWFSSAYILLLFIAPMLNAYIDKTSSRELRTWTILYIVFQICFSWFICIYTQFNRGYSVLSFLGLYMLGATLRKSSDKLGKSASFSIMCYILLSVITGTFMYLSARYITIEGVILKLQNMFGDYNGAGVILCSVLLFLGFKHMSLQSKIINRIAASTFAVYLFHMHPAMRIYYKDVCSYLFYNFNTFTYILLISLFIVGVFLFAVVIDQIRIRLWNVLWNQYLEPLTHKFTKIKV